MRTVSLVLLGLVLLGVAGYKHWQAVKQLDAATEEIAEQRKLIDKLQVKLREAEGDKLSMRSALSVQEFEAREESTLASHEFRTLLNGLQSLKDDHREFASAMTRALADYSEELRNLKGAINMLGAHPTPRWPPLP